jgi:hypothetical protein
MKINYTQHALPQSVKKTKMKTTSDLKRAMSPAANSNQSQPVKPPRAFVHRKEGRGKLILSQSNPPETVGFKRSLQPA